MPVKNGEKYIRQAFASIAEQNLNHVSLIVVDDGSTDASMDYCQQFKNDNVLPVSIMQGEAAGPAAARNVGIKAASSQYITFLDQDDCWPKSRLSDHCQYLKCNPQVDVIRGTTQIFGEGVPNNGRIVALDHLAAATFHRRVFDQVWLMVII